VIFECSAAEISRDPAVVAAPQARLSAGDQPEGGVRPQSAEEPLYRGALGTIAAVRLEIQQRRVKWKIGQNRSPEIRARVAAHLRQRGRLRDAHAADALEWTIDREAAR
jgi:predicted FMN-binding regulatory protein PaiB